MIKVVAVTGYKAHELGIFNQKHIGIKYIKKAIEQSLIRLLDDGLEWVIISGQLGVELWAGEVVCSLKKEYQHVKLAVLTPFLNQHEHWKEESKEYYEQIIKQADFVESISRKEYENPLQLKMKNQYLILKSDALLILYDEFRGGSPSYYLEPAKKRNELDGYEIFYITPDDIDTIMREEQEGN